MKKEKKKSLFHFFILHLAQHKCQVTRRLIVPSPNAGPKCLLRVRFIGRKVVFLIIRGMPLFFLTMEGLRRNTGKVRFRERLVNCNHSELYACCLVPDKSQLIFNCLYKGKPRHTWAPYWNRTLRELLTLGLQEIKKRKKRKDVIVSNHISI